MLFKNLNENLCELYTQIPEMGATGTNLDKEIKGENIEDKDEEITKRSDLGGFKAIG